MHSDRSGRGRGCDGGWSSGQCRQLQWSRCRRPSTTRQTQPMWTSDIAHVVERIPLAKKWHVGEMPNTTDEIFVKPARSAEPTCESPRLFTRRHPMMPPTTAELNMTTVIITVARSNV